MEQKKTKNLRNGKKTESRKRALNRDRPTKTSYIDTYIHTHGQFRTRSHKLQPKQTVKRLYEH